MILLFLLLVLSSMNLTIVEQQCFDMYLSDSWKFGYVESLSKLCEDIKKEAVQGEIEK